MAADAWSWVTVRVDGVAMRPTGVQSRAISVKGSWIEVPFLVAVAVSTTLNVPACVRLDPNRTMLVPSTWIKDGTEFNVYEIKSSQAGI